MAITQRRKTAARHRRELLALTLLVPAASCVPEARRLQSAGSLAPVSIELPPDIAAAPAPARAAALDLRDPAAAPFAFRADTGLDGLRALDCLAEAVYYEARSESEAGQRAVEIGGASCRERVWQSVQISVVAVDLKNKSQTKSAFI